MADNMTVAQRSRTMSRIRSRDTQPELTIRRLLHASGLRYRIHVGSLPGRPDIVFGGPKVAVFVDGDFWHGWAFSKWKDNLAPYWRTKIERNMRRDIETRRQLKEQGWTVVSLWEHEIEEDPAACAELVARAVDPSTNPLQSSAATHKSRGVDTGVVDGCDPSRNVRRTSQEI